MALYFPRIPVLEKLAALPSGRIWGVGCFPPNLNLTHGLEDVRGYDAVDPRDSVKLLELAVDPKRSVALAHARTQLATPLIWLTAAGPRLHPVADLLNVRYLIFRERPPAWLPVILQEDDYWIVENRQALPRAWVPHHVNVVKDDHQALSAMAGLDYDPRQTAFMTDELRLPDAMQGQASVRYESPTKAELDVEMQTAGLVLLADSWNAGWRAELDGASCPINRVDVALRGFQVPAGKHRIICAYDPPSLRIGFHAAAAGGIALFLWTLWKVRTVRRTPIVTAAALA
jgi:Bacterial membrane protein YfhO